MSETMKEVSQSESILKFALAFVKAQKEICGATKDKTNPHFKSQYADLSSVMEACKDPLNKNGIAVIQTPAPAEQGRIALTTRLLHESGEWIEGTGEIPMERTGPQAYGSALTYARRYFLAAMVGVCPEDDDANGATGDGKQQLKPQGQRTAPPKQETKPSEKPFVEMNEDEKFVATLHDAFEARDFQPAERSAVVASVCQAKKVSRITELKAEDRSAMVDAIATGKLDKHKKQQAA